MFPQDWENQLPAHKVLNNRNCDKAANDVSPPKKLKREPAHGKYSRLLGELKTDLMPQLLAPTSTERIGNLRSKYGRLQSFNVIPGYLPSDILRSPHYKRKQQTIVEKEPVSGPTLATSASEAENNPLYNPTSTFDETTTGMPAAEMENTPAVANVRRPSSDQVVEEEPELALEDTLESKEMASEEIEPVKAEIVDDVAMGRLKFVQSFQVGRLIWARLAKFPFWPALICMAPDTEQCYRRYFGSRERFELHVRFFGPKGLRSWISPNETLDFTADNVTDELRNGKRRHSKKSLSAKLKAELATAIADAQVLVEEPDLEERVTAFQAMIDKNEEALKMNQSAVFPRTKKRRRRQSSCEPEANLSKKTKLSEDRTLSSSASSTSSSSGVSTLKSIDDGTSSYSAQSETDADETFKGVPAHNKVPALTLEETMTAIWNAIPGDLNRELKRCGSINLCRICAWDDDKRGPLVKCAGPCGGSFHIGCLDHLDVQMDERLSATYKHQRTIGASADVSSSEEKHVPILHHVTGDTMDDETRVATPTISYKCLPCSTNKFPVCFICHKQDLLDDESSMTMCSVPHCRRAFHLKCLDKWPQAKKRNDSFICPQHQCHTCISDDPRTSNYRSKQRLLRCVFCPTSYHLDGNCLPAGTEILALGSIICQKHWANFMPPAVTGKKNKKRLHFNLNVNWCFICTRGGNLLLCDQCPGAFHTECLKMIPNPTDSSYICEECESGRFALYGELVWAKYGVYRWWPAIICSESMIPASLHQSRVHRRYRGNFCCKFLGSNDHAWISKRQVFLYHEDDALLPLDNNNVDESSGEYQNSSGSSSSSGKKVAALTTVAKGGGYLATYKRGLVEARIVNDILQKRKQKRQLVIKKFQCPLPYKKLRTNRVVPPVRLADFATDDDQTPCNCIAGQVSPCGPFSKCINRLLLTECQPSLCPAGAQCENQRMQKRAYPGLELVACTKAKGWGLCATEDLKAGDFVIEYVGELINNNEMRKRIRMKQEMKDDVYYFLTLTNNLIIDAERKGNMARFMNHSCEPNCETQKWTINGNTRVGLFTLTDIPAHTELTFNYNWESSAGTSKKECQCGSERCTGFIGDSKK